jgi:Lar family restriction alleviation protein
MSELKPCPFCGWTSGLKLVYHETGWYAIQCKQCCCVGPLYEKEEEAKQYWNERTDEHNIMIGG